MTPSGVTALSISRPAPWPSDVNSSRARGSSAKKRLSWDAITPPYVYIVVPQREILLIFWYWFGLFACRWRRVGVRVSGYPPACAAARDDSRESGIPCLAVSATPPHLRQDAATRPALPDGRTCPAPAPEPLSPSRSCAIAIRHPLFVIWSSTRGDLLRTSGYRDTRAPAAPTLPPAGWAWPGLAPTSPESSH